VREPCRDLWGEGGEEGKIRRDRRGKQIKSAPWKESEEGLDEEKGQTGKRKLSKKKEEIKWAGRELPSAGTARETRPRMSSCSPS